jgi:hypothetical protein
MTTIPYLHNGERIDIVPKSELDKALADNAELLERLEERTRSHIHASARDVQTIQQQAVELSAVKAALSGRTVSCSNCNESARTIDAMREAIKDAHEVIRLSAYPDHAALARLQPFLK